jgi:hypothetical protein
LLLFLSPPRPPLFPFPLPGPATLPRAPLAQAVCCSHRYDRSDNSLRLSVVPSTTRRELRFFTTLENSGSRPSLRPSTNSKSSDGRRQSGSPADGGQKYVVPQNLTSSISLLQRFITSFLPPWPQCTIDSPSLLYLRACVV